MTTAPTAESPVTVPFICPVCAGPNRVHLISLSRAEGMDCVTCGKWLRSADVMRAMHSPRAARTAESAPLRRHEPRAVALASVGGHVGGGARGVTSRRDRIVWPPTAATRAAANAAQSSQ